MGFTGYPGNPKGIHSDLLLHALELRAGKVKKVLLKNTFQRLVVDINGEKGLARHVKSTLNGPDNGQTLFYVLIILSLI